MEVSFEPKLSSVCIRGHWKFHPGWEEGRTQVTREKEKGSMDTETYYWSFGLWSNSPPSLWPFYGIATSRSNRDLKKKSRYKNPYITGQLPIIMDVLELPELQIVKQVKGGLNLFKTEHGRYLISLLLRIEMNLCMNYWENAGLLNMKI